MKSPKIKNSQKITHVKITRSSYYYYMGGCWGDNRDKKMNVNEKEIKWLGAGSVNPLTAKFNNLNCHPLEAISRYRDPQLLVGDNFSYLINLGPNICNSRCLSTHFVPSRPQCWFKGLIKRLTLVLLNCFNCIFCHLKLELLTPFPASNDEKYEYFSKKYIF